MKLVRYKTKMELNRVALVQEVRKGKGKGKINAVILEAPLTLVLLDKTEARYMTDIEGGAEIKAVKLRFLEIGKALGIRVSAERWLK